MKAKLIKTDKDNYTLFDEKGVPIGTTPNVLSNNTFSKLSKQNCDEIFGVVDIDKLAEEYVIDESYLPVYKEECKRAYINGYKAATKVYSEEDLKKAIDMCIDLMRDKYTEFRTHKETIIQSLQQTTEIEVEIEMETASLNPHDLICEEIVERPKLDSQGCLILKKI